MKISEWKKTLYLKEHTPGFLNKQRPFRRAAASLGIRTVRRVECGRKNEVYA